MIKMTLAFVVLATVSADARARKPVAPAVHCAKHSEVYAPSCPRLKRGYCKGDFQLCDLG